VVNRNLDLLGVSEVEGAPCPPFEFLDVVVVTVVVETGRMELRQRLEVLKKLLRALEVASRQQGVDDLVPLAGEVLHEGEGCINVADRQHRQRKLVGVLKS
jgi:hypothetical protein